MWKELTKVFCLLQSSDNCIQDDTCLHKLADCLQLILVDSNTVTSSDTLEFLREVTHTSNQTSDPVLVLALQVAGSLGCKNEIYTSLTDDIHQVFLNTWRAKEIHKRPSVLAAFYKSLGRIVSHQGAFLSWLAQHEDFMKEALSSIGKGRSIFLENEMMKFMTAVCLAEAEMSQKTNFRCIVRFFIHTVLRNYMKGQRQNTFHVSSSRVQPFAESLTVNGCSQEEQSALEHVPVEVSKSKDEFLYEPVAGNGFNPGNQCSEAQEARPTDQSMCSHLRLLTQCLDTDRAGNAGILLTKDLVTDLQWLVDTSGLCEGVLKLALDVLILCSDTLLGSEVIEAMGKRWFQVGEVKKSLMLVTELINLRQTKDGVLSPYPTEILTLPLKLVLGQLSEEETSRWRFVLEALKSEITCKSSLTKMCCSVVDMLGKVNIECGPDLTLTLLCSTCSTMSSSCIGQVCRKHLVDNSRIQLKCLQFFTAAVPSYYEEAVFTLAVKLASIIVEVVRGPNVDSVLYSQCMKTIVPLFPRLCETFSAGNEEQLSQHLIDMLQRHLCDLHWEKRDTTLEFLDKLLHQFKDNQCTLKWIEESRLHVHMFHSINDSESYVRATALSGLSRLMAVEQIWSSVLSTLGISQESVIKRVLHIHEFDTEAFARRSAGSFIFSLTQNKLPGRVACPLWWNICRTMVRAILNDFDWEVKLQAIQFWEDVIKYEFKHASTDANPANLKVICKIIGLLEYVGCWQALFSALEDYEQQVRDKACNVIKTIKEELGDQVEAFLRDDYIDKHMKDETLVKMKKSDSECKYCGFVCVRSVPERFSDKMLQDLKSVSEKLQKFNATECKQFHENDERNPLHLFEDILSYAKKDDEEILIDCY